jgi:hypothetical protein
MKLKRPIDYLPAQPHRAIYESWKGLHLNQVRDAMDIWFYATLKDSTRNYNDAVERAKFMLFYGNLGVVIEATYFYNKDRDTERKNEYEAASDKRKKELDSMNQPLNIPKEGITNAIHYMRIFCKRFLITDIRIALKNWFEAVSKWEGDFDIAKESAPGSYCVILALCEASYEIINKE